MRLHHLLVLSIVATGFVTFPLRADEDQLPQDKAQPEVLGRGPIHEGFAQPYDGNPTPPSEVAPKKPPEPIPEQPPDVKPDGKNVQWMPGYWQWDTTKNDFIWVSGFWRDVPEGRRWVPGYWTQSDNGWLWVSGHWAAAADKDFQYVPQPPQSLDQGPSTPAPDDNSVYVPGNWVYETAGYAWRPGYWNAYRPGFTWVPANYIWTPYGWTFVSGYWDYDFFDRGLLFAPVYFGSDFGFYPGYFFRPFYTCFFHRHWPYNFGFGFDSLFVHRGFHHFFFGDFHGSQFAHAGFRPWSQFVTHHFDPIFAHERIAHRGDPHWLSDLNAHVQGRANGTLPAFPHTLAAQQASGARGSNVHAGLTSISQLQHSGVNLHTASAAEIRAQQQLGNHLTLQSQMWSRNSSQLHTHTPTGNVGNNVNVHPGISGSSRSFTPSPSAHGPISNERTPNYNILNNSFHEHTPSTTPGRSFTPPPSANLPHAGGTAPNINSNIPRSQSSSTPHWTQSPNTNLNPGWSRPQQTFAPNNSMAPRTPSSVPYSNWNTPPHTSFSNPGTTRVPTMTVPNYNSTPHTQSFSRPSFTPQPTMTAPNHNSMPHTQSFSRPSFTPQPTYHPPNAGSMPHNSGGGYHPSSTGSTGGQPNHHH